MKKGVVLDQAELKELIRRRRNAGLDRRDEVWNGVYVIMPLGDVDHQELIGELGFAIRLGLGAGSPFRVFPGVNVSDRPEDWQQNFRCPDVAVYGPENPSQNRGSHWFGGPDFAVEIISRNDRSRKKFAFYAAVGVRELLFVARKPRRLELYRRQEQEWTLVGKSDLDNPVRLSSEVLGLAFRLVVGAERPRIEVSRIDGGEHWLV